MDLSAPAALPAPVQRASEASSSLDLSAPEAPPTPVPPPREPAPSVSSSLDLSAPARPVTPARPAATAVTPVRSRPRIGAREQRILDVRTPTVWLTRVQSGIGELRIEAVCSPEVGDLRLGALYQFASGATSTAQFAGGNRFAPSSRRPVIVGGREEYETLRLDLRQNREIERITVYAFSEARTPLTWGGTLVVETVSDGHVELPLDTLAAGPLAVLVSIYNVDGELVVRAETETIDGDVRDAARAYGYDRITWRDARSPVD